LPHALIFFIIIVAPAVEPREGTPSGGERTQKRREDSKAASQKGE
jgi:hypothetical protein